MPRLFENSQTKKENTDALDTLRKWIEKYGPSYGSLKPEIKIYAKKAVRIIIERGAETITLEKETPL
ncbi:MAG: hypothetical protein B6D55_02340 [Candidatus Omnitrophica bacterium 4484_70.2]|nr:MAG: hypothetical protein B6D55_02340 [Candidatus Omnitrophica bacterium 4484_70.2]